MTPARQSTSGEVSSDPKQEVRDVVGSRGLFHTRVDSGHCGSRVGGSGDRFGCGRRRRGSAGAGCRILLPVVHRRRVRADPSDDVGRDAGRSDAGCRRERPQQPHRPERSAAGPRSSLERGRGPGLCPLPRARRIREAHARPARRVRWRREGGRLFSSPAHRATHRCHPTQPRHRGALGRLDRDSRLTVAG